MSNPTYRPYGILESHRKLAVENLKLCPVCNTVNAKLNAECFVCRWHGTFGNDPDQIEAGLLDVLDQCPELIDCILTLPKRRPTILSVTWQWIRRRFRRSLNLMA